MTPTFAPEVPMPGHAHRSATPDVTPSAPAPSPGVAGGPSNAFQQMLALGEEPVVQDTTTFASAPLKPLKAIVDGGKNVHKAWKKRDGKVKRYGVRDSDEMFEHLGAAEVNTFDPLQQEFGKDALEDSIFKFGKAVGGGLKAASAYGGSHAIGAPDATTQGLASAGGLVKGGVRGISGGMDAVRMGHRVGQARKHQHQAEEDGDLLAKGLHATKRHQATARNDGVADVGIGALGVTDGVAGLVGAADPTGAGKLVHGITSAVYKPLKQGTDIYRGARKKRFGKERKAFRAAAEKGDRRAAEWMLENDPQMASAQLLMHIQDEEAPEDRRDFARQATGDVLGLSGHATASLDKAKLGTFDKIYSNRTHTSMTGSGLSEKEKRAQYKWSAIKHAPVVGGLAKKLEKAVVGKPKGPEDLGPEPMDPSHDLLWAMNEGNKIRDAKAASKALRKQGASKAEVEASWDSFGIHADAVPDRHHPVMREFKKIERYRAGKSLDELMDAADQNTIQQENKHFEDDRSKTKDERIDALWKAKRSKDSAVTSANKKVKAKLPGGKADTFANKHGEHVAKGVKKEMRRRDRHARKMKKGSKKGSKKKNGTIGGAANGLGFNKAKWPVLDEMFRQVRNDEKGAKGKGDHKGKANTTKGKKKMKARHVVSQTKRAEPGAYDTIYRRGIGDTGVRGGVFRVNDQEDSAAKQVAASRLDDRLGTDVIPTAVFADHDAKGATSVESSMRPAGELSEEELRNPETQRGLANLQLMDALTGHTARDLDSIGVKHGGRVEGKHDHADETFGEDDGLYQGQNAGLPAQVDAEVGLQLLQMSETEFLDLLAGQKKDDGQLSEASREQALESFARMKAHVDDLYMNDELIWQWNDETFDEAMDSDADSYLQRAAKA